MVTAHFRFPTPLQAPCPVTNWGSVIVATKPPPGVNVTRALYQSGRLGVPGPSVILVVQEPSRGLLGCRDLPWGKATPLPISAARTATAAAVAKMGTSFVLMSPPFPEPDSLVSRDIKGRFI